MVSAKEFYKADISEMESYNKYNKELLPKALKYHETLKKNTLEEYEIDPSKFPKSLDIKFNAVDYLCNEKLLTDGDILWGMYYGNECFMWSFDEAFID